MAKLPSKENKEKFVRETFNSIAVRYDVMNFLMSLGQDKYWRKFTVERSELKAGGFGLDVCCGTGMLTMEQVKVAGLSGKVTGLDFSENMLAVARENIKNFELKDNINFLQGNAMELPFKDNTFDCATNGWGLRNVPDILTTVKEMTRVVKPGAKVVGIDMAHPTVPVFKQIYWLIFNKIIPVMGKLAGNKSAYAYLHDSAKVFPPPQKLVEIFKAAGLTETKYFNLFGGAVAVVEGRKPRHGVDRNGPVI